MSRREYSRRCIAWTKAYLEALFLGNPVSLVPMLFDRQISLF